MLLNRVELGENRVIYNKLRNIGPATAGSAGPVPAPLYSNSCHGSSRNSKLAILE